MNRETHPGLDRVQRAALVVGIVALGVCLVGGLGSPEQFLRSHLLAFLLWANVAVGCLALLMLDHLVGGEWSLSIRRLLEAGARTLPLLIVFFLPILFGLPKLYVWTHPEEMADEVLQRKSVYLNVPFFVGRAAFYFAVWLLLAYLLNRWSARQDETGDPALARRLRNFSAPGLIIWALTVTFASIDWVMSLEPHWFSTIYGMLFMVGQAMAALALAIVALLFLRNRKPLAGFVRPQHFHDLGNLLLTFVMLWAYMSFAQYLIIWSGNLPEEIPWYLLRTGQGWQGMALVLIVLHFAVPFVLLLNRPIKRRAKGLAAVAAAIFLLRWVDLFWVAGPTFTGGALRIHWLDILLPIGLGGVWLAVYAWQLKARPLLPLQDPNLKKALEEAEAA